MRYGVYSSGGSIGNAETRLVVSFEDKDEARAKAKGLNGALSRGEKKYFGMKYTVRIIK